MNRSIACPPNSRRHHREARIASRRCRGCGRRISSDQNPASELLPSRGLLARKLPLRQAISLRLHQTSQVAPRGSHRSGCRRRSPVAYGPVLLQPRRATVQAPGPNLTPTVGGAHRSRYRLACKAARSLPRRPADSCQPADRLGERARSSSPMCLGSRVPRPLVEHPRLPDHQRCVHRGSPPRRWVATSRDV